MSMDWIACLRYDPLTPLLKSGDYAVGYFTRCDLLGRKVEAIHYMYGQPELVKILKSQRADGSWCVMNKSRSRYPEINYSLIDTWKQFRFLVQKYGLSNKEPAVENAAEFLFSCQTDEGDFRGFLAGQYAVYYTGAIIGLLIRAGYGNDPRIRKGIRWLLAMRQEDGGWVASPLMTLFLPAGKLHELISRIHDPVKDHDKTQPSSPHWTGMVLRAFAAHPIYGKTKEAWNAGCILKSGFFTRDYYTSYRHPDNWVRFDFPFWWNNLVSALDTLSSLGFSRDDPDILNGLDWLVEHQETDGLWNTSYSTIHKKPVTAKARRHRYWISLAICRIFKKFYS